MYVKKLNFQEHPNRNTGEGHKQNIYVTEDKICMANKYMKLCSASLIISEMQIKMRYYFIPTRLAKLKLC